MWWLVIAMAGFILQLATIVILEFRRPEKAAAWLLIMFIVPFIGFVMYYFLAKEYQQRRIVRRRGTAPESTWLNAVRRCALVHRPEDMSNPAFAHQERLFYMLQNVSLAPITSCNKTTVLSGGKMTFEAILQAMEQARHHIHLEYYTFRDDKIGRRFQEVMQRKAQEGVEIRLIYDGIGSYELKGGFLRELEKSGIQTHCFLPIRASFVNKRLNYRNHRKIVVVDGTVGFLGGINVGDEYLGENPKLGFWRDTHLQIEGDAVYYLQDIFMQDWWITAREKLYEKPYFPPHHGNYNEQVQIIASGPGNGMESIHEFVFTAIAVAKTRIYIETPYLIPDASILTGLKTAAISGVDVRLIIPQIADSQVVMHASLSYAEELLAAGVRIYRYQKGFIHAKVLIVDDLFASVGTANMDMRSFYSNFELNAVMFDSSAIRRLDEDFSRDLDNCKEISLYDFRQRPRTRKVAEVLARMLSPLL